MTSIIVCRAAVKDDVAERGEKRTQASSPYRFAFYISATGRVASNTGISIQPPF